jgi:hypothetical protein
MIVWPGCDDPVLTGNIRPTFFARLLQISRVYVGSSRSGPDHFVVSAVAIDHSPLFSLLAIVEKIRYTPLCLKDHHYYFLLINHTPKAAAKQITERLDPTA